MSSVTLVWSGGHDEGGGEALGVRECETLCDAEEERLGVGTAVLLAE
jgi:hypothetical protein